MTRPAARMGAKLANRDTLVVACRGSSLLAVLVVGGAIAACAPPPPADPTVAIREGAGEADAEAENEPAPALSPPAPGAHGPLVWLASEEEATSRGRAERRPVLVHFDADWCSDCKQMVNVTLGDPRVKTQAGRFVAVRIDATNDEDPRVSAVLSKYGVVSVPTLILLDSSGNEQRRFTELIGPDRLLGEIDRVR